MAKTSKNPGKTQTINHFEMVTGDGAWFLVDLPGYGFANAPEKASVGPFHSPARAVYLHAYSLDLRLNSGKYVFYTVSYWWREMKQTS